MSCGEIVKLNVSKTFCSENFNPNVTKILENKTVAKFIYGYARDNVNVLKVFIKDPFYTK